MEIRLDGIDICLVFSEEGLEDAVTPSGSRAPRSYPPFQGIIPGTNENLQFCCTNDGSNYTDGTQGIWYGHDEKGPMISVHTSEMLDLQRGMKPYLMRRIPGNRKLWILKEDPQSI
jgi:hypothetical protein